MNKAKTVINGTNRRIFWCDILWEYNGKEIGVTNLNRFHIRVYHCKRANKIPYFLRKYLNHSDMCAFYNYNKKIFSA